MKYFIKSRIFAFIIGALIFGSIGIVSAYAILAKDVSYTPKDSSWNVDNVKDALDNLYTKSATYKKLDTATTVNANNLLNGITAYDNNGNLITGSISADCVTGSFNSNNGYNTTSEKKLVSFSPKKFMVYETTSTWNGAHIWLSGWQTFVDINWMNSSIVTNQALSKYYTINNGLYIHNFPSNLTLYYIACK